MRSSAIFYGLVFWQAAVASPVVNPIDPEPEVKRQAIEPRMPGPGDIPFPRWPAKGPKSKGGNNKGCLPGDSHQQANLCSSGAPYCCTSDGNGGKVCQNTTACEQTVICCNNNNGFQICIGDMDFNVPITINIYND